MYNLDNVNMAMIRAQTSGWETPDSAGVYKERMRITGNVDVAEIITRNSVRKIIPATAGGDALIVRDAGDTEDRIKLTEDGGITLKGSMTIQGSITPAYNEVSDLGTTTLRFDLVTFKTLYGKYISSPLGRWDSHIHIRAYGTKDNAIDLGASRPNRWRNLVLGTKFYGQPDSADNVTTLVNSPLLQLEASVWDAVALAAKYQSFQLRQKPSDLDKGSLICEFVDTGGVVSEIFKLSQRGELAMLRGAFPISSGVVSVVAGGTYVVGSITVPTGKKMVIHAIAEIHDPDGYISAEVYNVTDAVSVASVDGFDDTGWEVSEGKTVEFRMLNADTVAAHDGHYAFLISFVTV